MTWLRTILAIVVGWWLTRRSAKAHDAQVSNKIAQKIAVAEADAPRDRRALAERLRDGRGF